MNLLLLLFNILKVIAVILLIFIGIALILICLVLFVPIKYDVFIKKYDKIEITIIFTWLLKFLTYVFNIKDKENYKQFKLAGVELWSNQKEKREKRKKKRNKKKSKLSFESTGINEKENYINNKVKHSSSNIKTNNKVKSESHLKDENVDDAKNKNSKENIEYLKSIFFKIKYIFQYEQRDIIIKYTKNLILKLFKIVKPRETVLNCSFGFSNPSLTGYVLGLISILSTYIPVDLNVKSDFERAIFNLDIKMKGKANLWSIGFPILIYILKKPIWEIIKNRKEDI